jgi:transcriptional regulator with XRE-family HTH domain
LTIIAHAYIQAGMSKLRDWRNAQKPRVSQSELAERLSTTQSHVSDIENAEDGVSIDVAARVFATTGVLIGRMKTATPRQARAIAEVFAP